MIVDPMSGQILGDPKVQPGESRIGFSSAFIGLKGSATMSKSSARDGAGKTNFTMSFSGTNGFAKVAPFLGSINFTVNMSVDKAGNVVFDRQHSTTKAYPSVEGYAYKMVQGQLMIQILFRVTEKTPDALNGPQNVPLTQ
jgi:hypothetical protein